MSDSEHLMWILSRMVNVHGENPNADYMLKLHQIARKIEDSIGKVNTKSGEWPQIGDKAECRGRGDIVVILAIDGLTCWVKDSHGCRFEIEASKMIKPKTEAEILRDELISTMDDSSTAFVYADHLAKHLIDKYNITKKPQ